MKRTRSRATAVRARGDTSPKLAFARSDDFFRETRRDVEEYLSGAGIRQKGKRELYQKVAIQVSLLMACWLYLIVDRRSLLAAIPGIMGITIGFILVGFCLLHDANHGAFFRSDRWNHLFGWSSDVLIGFGSYAWRVKHNIAHHTYPNIDGYDDDIAQTPLARLSPSQDRRRWYRFQHIYIWVLYAFLVLRWHIGSDIVPFKRRRIASSTLLRPKKWDLAGVIIGRALFIGWAFVIPLYIYSWWAVITAYLAITMIAGIVMAVVFQLAHCVEEATFSSPYDILTQSKSWAEHELESTVDFCRGNRAITWLLGGLNYQIEHHLFPRVPHTHYPAIALIVERNATKHGLPYPTHPSLASALRSHYRHLRTMGRRGVRVELEMG